MGFHQPQSTALYPSSYENGEANQKAQEKNRLPTRNHNLPNNKDLCLHQNHTNFTISHKVVKYFFDSYQNNGEQGVGK